MRTKHLFPRALLTPFTDNVDLTSADRRAYTDAATAQRHKEFESVDVTFDHDGQEASAREADRQRADDESTGNRTHRRRMTDRIHRARPIRAGSSDYVSRIRFQRSKADLARHPWTR